LWDPNIEGVRASSVLSAQAKAQAAPTAGSGSNDKRPEVVADKPADGEKSDNVPDDNEPLDAPVDDEHVEAVAED
jgi:hypothetical protein